MFTVRTSPILGSIVAGGFAGALLAGCTGSTLAPPSGIAPQSAALRVAAPFGATPGGIVSSGRVPFVDVAAIEKPNGNQVFISDAKTATVTVWGGAGQLDAILFDGIGANPTGLATDRQENLYVANEALGQVVVYAKPYTAIVSTLDDAAELPLNVAVSTSGIVAVANYLTTSLQPGSVSFYAKGVTSPCATIVASNWIYFYFDAFDAAGNLYVDGKDVNGQTLVGKIVGGCKATSLATLSLKNTIGTPGGMSVSRGHILITDSAAQTVYTYAAPHGNALGSPIQSTRLSGTSNPTALAMMEGNQNLWAVDYSATTPNAGKYTYPGGTAGSKITANTLPAGLAVIPAAQP